MAEIKRIYPGPVNGLINYLEENFHDIDEYIVAVKTKDGLLTVAYDVYTYVEAIGMAEVTKETLHEIAREGEFVCKE